MSNVERDMDDSTRAAHGPDGRGAGWKLGLLGVLVVAFASRLTAGMLVPLEGDESSSGISALRILHGHLVPMEVNARYLGALDSYIMAPFVGLLGPNLFAVRLTFSLVGAAYCWLMFLLGRRLLGGARRGLLVAGIAAVFPLFTLSFGTKARNYGLLLPIETLVFLFALRLAWPATVARGRDWAAYGLISGIAIWHQPLLAMPVVLGVAAVAVRTPRSTWGRSLRGARLGLVGFLLGYSPWLIYNATSRLGSLRHLYGPAQAYTIAIPQAVRGLLDAAIPVFLGSRVNYCGPVIVPALLVDVAIAGVVVGTLWARRGPVGKVLRGHMRGLEPVDMVLAAGPLALAAVTLGPFNGLSCEPRYLMPLGPPLVIAVAVAAVAAWRWWPVMLVAAAGYLAVAGMTVVQSGSMYHDLVGTVTGVQGHPDMTTAAEQLKSRRPEAVWADVAVARELQFLSGDTLVVGEYGGTVGFNDTQRVALGAQHPSWLFLSNDPGIGTFRSECRRRGILFQEVDISRGLILFDRLTMPLDLGVLKVPTQSLDQAR